MDLEQYYKWESMGISSIIYVMVKWLNFHDVTLNTRYRKDVESGIWFDIEIREDDKYDKPAFSISAQRTDILRRRLIEYLDKKNLRPEEFKQKF